MNKETCYVQSSVVLVFFFHNCELSQYNLLDTQWQKKLRNDCLSSSSSFSFSFFFSWPFLSTFYLPSSRIDYTYSFFFFAGLSSKYWWGVWYRVFGRHQPSLDGIIWSLKYFWELPPSTPHLSQPDRPAQWRRGCYVSSQVWTVSFNLFLL